ncbi:MAG: hypothetical protein HUU56_16610 [Bdellovibrionaceae bacterium]|nr:hypothetical protein [Pseudobdellovibrionaceae bacterium]
MTISSTFPYDGQLFKSSNKKYLETIFFVHFYEGSKTLMKRHIDLVNELGFDAFAFNLISTKEMLKNPLSKKNIFGIKHIWADQIEFLLNSLPEDKILFSFSNPSSSAIESMYYRQCRDVKAMICDSGPSGKFITSFYNLLRYYKEKGMIESLLKAVFTPIFWSQHLHKDMDTHLKSFPKNFPILSIRGWKDKLIPPDHIDCVFEGHPQLMWRKLSLPKAGHLNGLKDFKEEYIQGVKLFLSEFATPISS